MTLLKNLRNIFITATLPLFLSCESVNYPVLRPISSENAPQLVCADVDMKFTDHEYSHQRLYEINFTRDVCHSIDLAVATYSDLFAQDGKKLAERDKNFLKKHCHSLYADWFQHYDADNWKKVNLENLFEYELDSYFLKMGLKYAKKEDASNLELISGESFLGYVTREDAFPLNPDAHYWRGVALYKLGENQKADQEFKIANSLWPYNINQTKQRIDKKILSQLAKIKND
jgi:hypothetical protein